MFFEDTEVEDIPTKSTKSSVKLNGYKLRSFKSYIEMTNEELESGAGGYLVGDVEVFENYFLIAFKCINTNKVVIFEKDENKTFDIRKLYWLMHNYTCIGFNWLKFDLPLLWYAHREASLEQLKELTRQIIFDGLRVDEFEKGYNIKIPKTNNIDLMEVCPLKGSLKTYGARLHCERLQDLPFDPDTELSDVEKRIVRDYCINDLDTTMLLFNSLLEQLKLRDELGQKYREDLMSKSDAQMAEVIMSAEIQRITGRPPGKAKIEPGRIIKYKPPAYLKFKTPIMQRAFDTIISADYVVQPNGRLPIPEEIKSLTLRVGNNSFKLGNGGLHSQEKTQAFIVNDEYDLVDRDVESYYPNIQINSGIIPVNLGANYIIVLKVLKDRRVYAKAHKIYAEDSGLKITINGSFGKTGSPHSIMYDPELFIYTTITGQLTLLMFIEWLEEAGATVISANTDGVVFKRPHALKDRIEAAIQAWGIATDFKTEETRYTAVYSRDVNAYIAVKEDGSCKGKNAYFDPWSGGAKAAIFRFHKNPRSTICIEAVNQFLTVGTPLQETITTCKDIKKFVAVQNVKGGAHKNGDYLGKVVRWYYSKGERGTINKIENNNTVPESEGATPLMDLPTELPIDIDYDWYIKKAEQMLIDIGHTKKPGEISFFD